MIIFTTALRLFLELNAISPEVTDQNSSFWIKQLQNSIADIRVNAAHKLGEVRSASAVSELSKLSDDPIATVRFAAIQALARIGTVEAKEALNQNFANEKDPYLQAEMKRGIKAIQEMEMRASTPNSNSKK